MSRAWCVALVLACGSPIPVVIDESAPDAGAPPAPPPPIVFLEQDAGPEQVATDCASSTPEATLTRSAIDIVLLVDNSDSMAAEAEAIEQHINDGLAARLTQAEVNYRVILISEHRSFPRDGSSGALCIEQPLSGLSSCNFADRPVLSSRFFHYSARVGSQNSLPLLLDTFSEPFANPTREDTYDNAPSGWSQWLRTGAPKVIVAFTDDDALMQADTFMDQLFQLGPGHFGSAESPNFVFHTVAGMASSAEGLAYEPEAPIVEELCGDPTTEIASAGSNLQELSRATGGLRFSLCDTATYESLFQTLASNVVVTSNLPCNFPIPASRDGRRLDLDRVEVVLKDDAGEELQLLGQVSNPALCASDAFYVDAEREVIQLCDQACTQARQVLARSLDLKVACESTILR